MVILSTVVLKADVLHLLVVRFPLLQLRSYADRRWSSGRIADSKNWRSSVCCSENHTFTCATVLDPQYKATRPMLRSNHLNAGWKSGLAIDRAQTLLLGSANLSTGLLSTRLLVQQIQTLA